MIICSDSQSVVKQILGEYEARGVKMSKYLAEVKDWLLHFEFYIFQGVDRLDYTVADALSKLATTEASTFYGSVYLEVLNAPSVSRLEVSAIDRLDCWLTPYIEYLNDRILPSDWVLAKKIKYKSSYFTLIDGDLYRRAFSSPLLKCLTPSEATYVLQEVREGVCGDHLGAKTLAYKVLR